MENWKYAQRDPTEARAKLHFFSVTKKHAAGEIEARITIKEFATPSNTDFAFFAEADIELNQKALRFRPCGWHEMMMGALAECMRNLRRFDFEHPDADTAPCGD
jgi:hypothetical protein